MSGLEQTKIPDSTSRSPDLAQDREIQVLCACDERYLPHAATMLCSLLEHNSVFRIHFFYSSVGDDDLAKLKSFVARYRSKIVCYEVSSAELKDLRVDKWASTAVYYRLLAPRLLPADMNKILYLDSDLIVRGSLSDLWNTDLADKALAAVPDCWQDSKSLAVLPAGEKLFNSGVLLINLRFWRQHNVPRQAIEFVKRYPEKVQFWDQDALNAILVHRWIELPVCWNAQNEAQWARASGREKIMEPAVVHFINADKPWHWSNNHPFKNEYRKYRLKTPWRRYRQEGQPRLSQRLYLFLRSVARTVLPGRVRQWLRARRA
jgi:lipopolysaccharide biosynthesis glycosyltransferase